MKQSLLAVIAIAALAACSSPEDVADEVGVDDASVAQAPAKALPQPPAAPGVPQVSSQAVNVNEDNELLSFGYSYPQEVAAIPELKAQFDAELNDSRSTLEAQAREAQADARANGFPYNAYALGTQWKVVANTERFLSLSAEIYTYTGGAHPNTGASALVWDRETKRAIEPLAFFTSADALNQAVSDPYCSALDTQRAKRRGEPVDRGDGLFGACPSVDELTVLLGSSNGKSFDRIGLIASPYVAGPYVEGEYEVTVPVSEPVMQAVRPAYRAAFSRR